MNNGNRNKNDVLGMPYGTACNRLRKQVLFSILRRHGENNCYRCKEEILSAEELSLEHFEPWLGNASLFWDTANIGFSHLRCNSSAHRVVTTFIAGHVPKNSKFPQAPLGAKWCGQCKHYQQKFEFSKNRSKRDGLEDICIKCRSESRSRSTVGLVA